MNEGVVESGVDVSYTEYVLIGGYIRSEDFLLLGVVLPLRL